MLAALLPLQAPDNHLSLYRGVSIGTPGYWAVEDTYLDKLEPTLDHGGSFTVLGGEGKTILIRFGDLRRLIGSRSVTGAKLVLSPSGGDIPRLKSVTIVRDAWGEGPASTLSHIFKATDPKAPKVAKPAVPVAAKGSATWNERRAGIANWGSAGFPDGRTLDGAKGDTAERSFTISGIEDAVREWQTNPSANFGLSLRFENDVEFFSSQAPSGRPKLELDLGDASAGTADLEVTKIVKTDAGWVAHLHRTNAPAGAKLQGVWWVNGKAGSPVALDTWTGDDVTVTLTGENPKLDPQLPTLGFQVLPVEGEGNTSNNRVDVFPDAKPVVLAGSAADAQTAVEYWNETVTRQSRFSFAPDGVNAHVRLEDVKPAEAITSLSSMLRQIGAAVGLPQSASSGDLYPGLMGYGDSRFEGTIPGKLSLPYEPYPSPSTETALLEPTGLLSASDVIRLQTPATPLPMPRATLLRMTDLVGRVLANVDVTVEQPGAETTILKSGPSGTIVLTNKGANGPFGLIDPNLTNGTLTLKVTQNGVTETAKVKAWRISEEFKRSASPAILMDVRFNVPMLPLDGGTNLALERIGSDSVHTDPSKLAALTDGDDVSVVTLPDAPNAWVELDLGRDRTIGEVALKFGGAGFWSRYDVMVYATGQRPEEALPWAKELDSTWTAKNRLSAGWVSYRSPVQRVRFIRIISRSGGAASLAEIKVVPVKIANQP